MTFDVLVDVKLRPGISDPAGQTVEKSLPTLGFTDVSGVHIGKAIRLTIEASDEATATARVQELEEKINELETLVTGLNKEVGKPLRRRLSDTRMAVNHKFDIAGHEGYLTVGLFEDGRPGELFVTMAKEGSTIGGPMDTIEF